MSEFALSNAASKLLSDLRKALQPPGFFARVQDPVARVVSALQGMVGTTEIGLIPEIVPLCLDANEEIREAACLILTRLLSGVSWDRLPGFELWFRQAETSWGRWENAWAKMAPDQVRTFQGITMGPLALASFHTNGRVREAALRLLSARRDGQELPFLLLRLNDWVEPVRQVARTILEERFRDEYASRIVDHMPLLLRVVKGRRAAHAWLEEKLADLLGREANLAALRQGLHSPHRTVRLACIRLVAQTSPDTVEEALLAVLQDPDAQCRFWAARELLAKSGHGDWVGLQETLRADPFMPVRKAGLEAWVERNPSDARGALIHALLDRHHSLRTLAQHHLQGKMDVPDYYRRQVLSPDSRLRARALLGLSECGLPSDVGLASPCLESTELGLRRAAVIACGRLAPKEFAGQLFRALSDPSVAVSNAACIALRPLADEFQAELGVLLRTHPGWQVRRNGLRLIVLLGKWNRLPHVLAACKDAQGSVVTFAQGALASWLRRYNAHFNGPTAAQLAAARNELRSGTKAFSGETLRRVISCLDSWKDRVS